MSDQYIATEWTNVCVFAVLILVLILRPSGLLGVFEHRSVSNPILALHGIVNLGRPGELTLELLPDERPWDRLDHPSTGALAPGIYLAAALDLGMTASGARQGEPSPH